MIAPAFLLFIAVVAAGVVGVAARVLPRRMAGVVAIGLAAWLVYVGALSGLDIVRDAALRPPGIVYIVAPAVLFVLLIAARSRAGGAIARAVPLAWLIGFQAYRVGVELFLHGLWREGLVPRMLTWSGANVDVWVGLSAPLVAILATRGLVGRRVAGAWSVLGLASIANVAVRSALTTPGPLHLLASEVPNRAIGTFPYTYIAGFFAPLAVTLHVLALRRLAARTDAGRIPSPAGTTA